MQEKEYAWKKERKFAIYFHSIIQFVRQSRTFGPFSITITFYVPNHEQFRSPLGT